VRDPLGVESTNVNKSVTLLWQKQWIRIVACIVAIALLAIGTLAVPYYRLAARIDKQLAGSLTNAVDFYSAPEMIAPGDPMTPNEVAEAQQRSARPIRISLANGRITSIVDASTRQSLPVDELKPELLTNLSDQGRARRMPVYFSEIPPVLRSAILAAEDKRFFHHSGFDTRRIARAIYIDVKERRKEQGASTITMQLARNLWLGRDKSWKRKIEEALITVHLEHKLSKEAIFERYCNLIYLGGDGAFGIKGVGEASQAYFNKDVRKLTLPEAAMIAGLIQRPVFFNPFRYPDRALERRNVVLRRMFENRFINLAEYEEAIAAPLGLHADTPELSESQYFVDAAAKEAARLQDQQDQPASAVFTTLDPRLEQAAERAIADGMALVGKQLAARHKAGRPQVALIALDPHTGEIKALCGGRDYAASQLDRIFAKRPPGSVFKPFVYTAALSTAVEGGDPVFTQASLVDDSPTTFDNGTQTYNPSNFNHQFMGQVMFRTALAHSLNVATVKVGEMAGFGKVVSLARRALIK